MGERAVQELDRLAELAGCQPEQIIEAAMAAARETLGMDMSFVSRFDGEMQEFERVAGDLVFDLPKGTTVTASANYCESMVRGVIPNVVPDTTGDARTRDLAATTTLGVRAYVGVPLTLANGTVYGSFCCIDRKQCGDRVDERDVKFMHVLARLVADEIERKRAEHRTRRLEAQADAAQALLAALDAREHYTGEHSRQVLDLAIAVARQMGMSEDEVIEVGQVALLHDIGKVGVPDDVLQKPGPLSDDEWVTMREHPAIGERIVSSIDGLAHLAPAIRAEHERWDGAGYPDGLSGDDIPLPAQICLAADAFHAMTSDRPYRAAMPHAGALDELRANSGTQFGPGVVDGLVAVLRTHPLAAAAAQRG